MQSIQLTFDDSAEADFGITFSDGREPIAGPIGLDGVFRTSPGTWGLPVGVRGTWTDEHTFVFEHDEIANNGALIVTLRFDTNDVTMEVQERTVEGTVSISGTASLEVVEAPHIGWRFATRLNATTQCRSGGLPATGMASL